MQTVMDDRRIKEVGAQLARRDHERRRPQPGESHARFWAPTFREGYEEERTRLGCCAAGEHVYRASRVSSSSPDVIQRMRPLGALIEICERCGVWQDRPRH